jgi:formylglycine-generating enzyme required for sulfatase activity
MGTDPRKYERAPSDELPQHQVCITQPFWIDLTEVTNSAYQAFIDDGGYTKRDLWSPEGWAWKTSNDITGPDNTNSAFTAPDQPRVGISFYEAEAYARWRGGRLPTEAEWEYAARGTTGFNYPWGDVYSRGSANANETEIGGVYLRTTAPVGQYPKTRSWVGALDMAANACEWVADWYDAGYYAVSPKDDPRGPETGAQKVVRGGSYSNPPPDARTSNREARDPGQQSLRCGLRVISN